MINVAITPRGFRQTPGRHHELLGEYGLNPRFPKVDRPLVPDEVAEFLAGCEAAILGVDQVDAESLAAAESLKVIVRFGSGVDNIPLECTRRRGIQVAFTPGANTVSVVELTLGLMLSAARHVPSMDRSVRAGSWSRRTGVELAGRCLGLFGAGRVGRGVALRAEAMGMRVIAHDPFAGESPLTLVGFDELLEQSDVISIHSPLSSETAGIFDHSAIDRMRTGSILINTARGGIVDEVALAEALRSGKLLAAALDSFATEPLAESPLTDLDNVILTPHAGAATVEAIVRAGVAAVEEVNRAVRGEPLANPVS